MKNLQKEFLKILTDYQGIIHKVNLAYFKSDMEKKITFRK